MRTPTATGALALVTATVCLALAGCGSAGSISAPSAVALSMTCSASPTSGVAPLIVGLAVQLSPPTASVVVQYGDGTSGVNPEAAHTYKNPGSYNLVVNATSGSQNATCQNVITVSAPPPKPPNQPPVIRFHVSPNPPTGPAPLDVNLNLCQSSDPDGDQLRFHFDFGDGTEDEGCRVTHTYSHGTFTAKACVTDTQPGHEVCQTVVVNAQ